MTEVKAWSATNAGTSGQEGPVRRHPNPMTVVGGYTLHLYCCMINQNHSWQDTKTTEFYAQTGAQCRRLARAQGWKFNRDNTATCPRCSKELKGK